MDRQNSFIPETYRLLHNAVFFAVGVVLHRSRGELFQLATHSFAFVALSLPVFCARAWLIQRDLDSPLYGTAAWALAATGSLFSWLITFGFLGLALGAFNRPRPVIRYIADSSYWIYLCHLPIVGLLQANLWAISAGPGQIPRGVDGDPGPWYRKLSCVSALYVPRRLAPWPSRPARPGPAIAKRRSVGHRPPSLVEDAGAGYGRSKAPTKQSLRAS